MLPEEDEKIKDFYNSLNSSQRKAYLEINNLIILDEEIEEDGMVKLTLELDDAFHAKLKTIADNKGVDISNVINLCLLEANDMLEPTKKE